ncbi:MASE3 domain-containing protein [Halobellus sp. GM3]|uniref:MASE3 domain-containing protein n=1 Tax=Halobellus sp. GM3 TaxID=3458410 RepID=UPI00403DF80D
MARASALKGFRTHLILGLVGVVALYLIQVRNYLLFHSLVELFSVTVAFAVFIVVWNARGDIENPFFAVLGVAYLFIGAVDLLHTLAYQGMGVFATDGANLPTQLWLLGRYLEAFSLVGAAGLAITVQSRSRPRSKRDDDSLALVVVGYAAVVALGLSSVFVFDVFPQAYSPAGGLTDFKIVSEYVVMGLLLLSILFLSRRRERFESRVYQLLVAAVALSVVSELAFTFYIDVYGVSNAAGHFLKFGSFYLMYLAVVKTGITEPQKTLYRALARREAEARRFEEAVEHSGHAVVITDRDGTIEYVNPAYEEVTGYTEAELLGENPRILQSGEHDDAFFEELWGTILAGEVWESEFVDERKSGERFVVNQTIAPITDEEGEIRHFVGVHKDISERKKQEQELLERYDLLFNSIRDAIFVVDRDHRITNANPAFTGLFGYELDDVAGDSARVLYDSEESFARVRREVRKRANEGRFTQMIEYEKRTGQIFPGETTVFRLHDADGEEVGFITLVRDVSDRENRIQQLKVLDRMLRHNLRNDMNVIQGYADLIRHRNGEAVAEDAREIIETSDRIVETVNKQREVTELLSRSRPPQRVDLTSAVDTVAAAVREQYGPVQLSVSMPEECYARAVPSISRAIEELVENAVIHSGRTEPAVEVSLDCTDEWAEITVADDGPGIPEIERQVLTGEIEIGPLQHGSGVGLWLVDLIVEQSDGVLSFDEREPRGSEVTVRLQAE